jgi:hypothetical protein
MDPSLPVAPESRRKRALDRERYVMPVDVDLSRQALLAEFHTETCPQCGVNPAGRAQPRTLQWVSPWIYAGFFVNVLVLAALYYLLRQRVTASLPLCPDCEAADKRGRRATAASYWGVLLAPIACAIAASPFDAAGYASLVGLVAGVVGAVYTTVKMRPQVIEVRRIDKDRDLVRLRASPSWRAVLEREKPTALKEGALLGVGR